MRVLPTKEHILPTKEVLAEALNQRYGGRPVAPDDIVDRMFEGDEFAFQFQAWRNAMVDWYEVPVDRNGAVEPERIVMQPSF